MLNYTEQQIADLLATIPNAIPFVAVYGTTTFAEIKAAFDAGRMVICTRSDNSVKYILTGLSATAAHFFGMGVSANTIYRVYVDSTWHAASISLT